MAEKHLKKCSMSLVIRDIQMTLRFHIRSDSTCWQGCGTGEAYLHCWCEYKLVQPLWKSIWWFLRKLEIVLPQDQAIPLLGIYLKDVRASPKDTCSSMLIAAQYFDQIFSLFTFQMLSPFLISSLKIPSPLPLLTKLPGYSCFLALTFFYTGAQNLHRTKDLSSH